MEAIRARVNRLREEWNTKEANRVKETIRKRLQRLSLHEEVEEADLRLLLQELNQMGGNRRRNARRDEACDRWENEVITLRRRADAGYDILEEARRLAQTLEVYIRQCRNRKSTHVSACMALEGHLSEIKHIINQVENHSLVSWSVVETAFQHRIVSGIVSNHGISDPHQFLNEAGK